jgi:hypothetical protein
MTKASKLGRRRFLKYVGAGAVAAGGAATAYYLRNAPLGREPEVTIPTVTEAATMVDYPPYADFKWKPYYLNPTDQQAIQFTNMSYDLGGDLLTNAWLVDNRVVSHERDYSTKLPVGEHLVDLQVSDGKQTRVKSATVTVDPDQIYPEKPLHLRYKGVRYFAGTVIPEWSGTPNPSNEEMDEQLDTIQNELGCNAIAVCGGKPSEDRMIECSRMTIEKGFERIFVQPSYVNATVDETIERIGKFGAKLRGLREMSDAVVYMVGHEFQLETAIIRGRDWSERFANANKGIDLDKVAAVYPRMFKRIIDVCKQNYGYPISYAGTPWELDEDLIPWSNPAFESIGIDAYIHDFLGWNEDWMIALLNRLKRFKKPIHCADFGMMSFVDADKFGGWSPLYAREYAYDEEPQARYTRRTLDMLNRARIDGCFWVQYNDNWVVGQGLYHPLTRKRKKGFYMYKSYQRAP